MEIYLVRHGQTGGNLASRHQAEDTKLTPLGKTQVAKAAEEIKKFNPTHLLTSNLVRAIQTATIIGDACDLTPDTSGNFIELVRPKHIYGRHHASIQSIWHYLLWYFGRETYEFDGGESYSLLRERIKRAQVELSAYPDDARLVVVSHAVFMNMFLAHLCFQKPLSPMTALRVFGKMLKIPNAKIIPIKFDSSSKENTCAWSVDY